MILFLLSMSCTIESDDVASASDTLRQELNSFIDQWHRDAATADPAYFDKMSATAVYIGTDPTEHWTRDEFRKWSQSYFDSGEAWDFEPVERNLYFSESGQVAWFDELLATWMGTCRGSGVLIRKNGAWLMEHYHLSISVPNEATRAVIEIIANEKPVEQE